MEDDTTKLDKFYQNYMSLIKKLPTKEAEAFKEERKEGLKDLLTSKNFTSVEMNQEFFEW